MSKAALKSYRSIIRDAWLPLVGRRKLTSPEYVYTEQLFNSSIEIDTVLWAIRRCAARALGANYTIYSLGVIKADIEVVMKEKSRMAIGAHKPDAADAWRIQWRRDVEDLISLVDEPFCSAYQALLADLDSLSLDEAKERWQAIQRLKAE